MKDCIAFIDVETDSLNAHDGHLLEIACLVTDTDLNVLEGEGFHAVVYYSPSDADDMRYAANPVVQEMHDVTGLWHKLSGPKALHLHNVDSRLRKYLSRFGRAHQMPVGGNSVRLDMNFMDRHLPKTANFLHYQMRDVTTVAKLAQAWYPDLAEFEKRSDHTAMVDIRESIRELQYYRQAVFKASFAKMPQWERDEVTADVMSYLLSCGYTITAPGGGKVSETADPKRDWLVGELRILPEFAIGTRNGELVPLADFMRERMANAMTLAADTLEVKK
jgi:Oligoribonuclease (3''->5'' exoribonuclease)